MRIFKLMSVWVLRCMGVLLTCQVFGFQGAAQWEKPGISGGGVLRGTAISFRRSATHTRLPAYPPTLSKAGKGGLVVIEAVVSPAGRVSSAVIVESFDEKASAASIEAVKQWQFRTLQELLAVGLLRIPCDCVRINRLAFDFRVEEGVSRVIDLSQEAIERRRLPDPFRNLKQQ